MPGDTLTAGTAGTMVTEDEKSFNLVGTRGNNARDPKRASKEGKGSIGDKALMDSIVIVAFAWALLVFLAYSLRHHNV